MTTSEMQSRFENIGVRFDQITKSNGIFTVRRGFFYTNGMTSEVYVRKVKELFPEANIIDHGEIWKDFRGGAPVAKQSHWYVRFSI